MPEVLHSAKKLQPSLTSTSSSASLELEEMDEEWCYFGRPGECDEVPNQGKNKEKVMPKCKEAPSTEKMCKYVNPDSTPCTRERLAHELCWTHYQQERRGRPLTPIRTKGLVLLPGNVRVPLREAAVLEVREADGLAHSVYEASRQAIEAGVAVWTAPYTAEDNSKLEKAMNKIVKRLKKQAAERAAAREAAKAAKSV